MRVFWQLKKCLREHDLFSVLNNTYKLLESLKIHQIWSMCNINNVNILQTEILAAKTRGDTLKRSQLV